MSALRGYGHGLDYSDGLPMFEQRLVWIEDRLERAAYTGTVFAAWCLASGRLAGFDPERFRWEKKLRL